MSKKRKTHKILSEAEYYTGVQTGQQSPETLSAYEYSRDNAPVLSKLSNLKDQQPGGLNPQALPFPLQDAVIQLGNLYLQTLDLKNKPIAHLRVLRSAIARVQDARCRVRF